jgi:hypothetical protein
MVETRNVRIAITAVLCALACSRQPDTENRAVPPSAPPPKTVTTAVVRISSQDLRATNLTCFRPESLGRSGFIQFGESAFDSTTGDVTGLTFRFAIADTGITGSALDITGDPAAVESDPFNELILDLHTGKTHFAYEEGENRGQFDGMISCDSLWGRWEPYPNQVRANRAFKRTAY